MEKNSFNFSKFKTAGRKRIRDRGITWRETYKEKSEPLKRRFDKAIGFGAYYRWEGHDYTTNSDYFVVVGPAKTKEDKKMFFSGVKKLPPKYKRMKIYAPSGKYFTNILSALSHASKMWGVRFPPNQTNYTQADLADVNIPRHIKA